MPALPALPALPAPLAHFATIPTFTQPPCRRQSTATVSASTQRPLMVSNTNKPLAMQPPIMQLTINEYRVLAETVAVD